MTQPLTLGQHPIDPDGPHRAVPAFARLVARGRMTRAIALDALLHAAQHLRHPRADPRGLQTRLTHRLDDAIAAEQFRRDAAAEAIQRAIIPLVLNGRPRRALVAAADTADQRHDLHPAERLGVIEGEIAWALRTGAIQLRTAHAG